MSNPQVELHVTNYGVITLELDNEKAPQSVTLLAIPKYTRVYS